MTDQTNEATELADDEYAVQLRATFVPEGERQIRICSVGSAMGATIITPVLEQDDEGDDVLVIDVLTAVPALELADLLDMIGEGLRNGTVTATAVGGDRG